jgi:hypothetical protein
MKGMFSLTHVSKIFSYDFRVYFFCFTFKSYFPPKSDNKYIDVFPLVYNVRMITIRSDKLRVIIITAITI